MTEENEGNRSNGFDIAKLADADAKFRNQAAEIAKQFEAANPHLKSLQDAVENSGITSATKAMQDALNNSGLSAAMEATKALSANLDPLRDKMSAASEVTKALSANLDPLREHASAAAEMAKLAAPAQSMVDQLKASGIYDRMDALSTVAGEGSKLADAIRGIEKQQHALDAMIDREPVMPRIDHIKITENPIVETNRKLDRIEKQFSHISTIAHDSAQVATDLQAYAAEFLQKFERAADDANQSGSKAIKVGWLALAIALVVGAGQVFAPTLMMDHEAEALRQSVVDLNTEISTLRREQIAANDRLVDALASSDQAMADAVREALATIAAQPTAE